ncbi:hypothetical protein NE237_013423 [Protea cynaroides]|uniref:Uncharacterized protein n=1 Tax=Protea cynaroides TaxID=273540 RepID=A0A9Q0GZX0_9MAGN|nr:hypothetical protein NE237_013423 [Protea cynaroides]
MTKTAENSRGSPLEAFVGNQSVSFRSRNHFGTLLIVKVGGLRLLGGAFVEPNRRKRKRKVGCLWGEAIWPRIGGGLSSGSPLLAKINGSEGGLGSIFGLGGRGVYSTHSPVSRTAQVSVRLRMRTSFPSRRKGGQQVPQALCPTHLSKSKCSSPFPLNAPISQQRSCDSRSFPVHSLCISDTQGRTRWEGSSPSLCPADHSAGILHSRPRLTAARGCSCRYVSLSGLLAPPVISFYEILLSSPYLFHMSLSHVYLVAGQPLRA